MLLLVGGWWLVVSSSAATTATGHIPDETVTGLDEKRAWCPFLNGRRRDPHSSCDADFSVLIHGNLQALSEWTRFRSGIRAFR